MTLDDQLRALDLPPTTVARLAGYSSPEQQLRQYRHRGSRIPDNRLRVIAQRLRELADVAESLVTPAPTR